MKWFWGSISAKVVVALMLKLMSPLILRWEIEMLTSTYVDLHALLIKKDFIILVQVPSTLIQYRPQLSSHTTSSNMIYDSGGLKCWTKRLHNFLANIGVQSLYGYLVGIWVINWDSLVFFFFWRKLLTAK